MNFLTDANVFQAFVKALRSLGHNVLDIKEQGFERFSDAEIFTLAQGEKRILISMDKDFSNIIRYPPGTHHGIIVVKLYRITILEATNIFTGAIRQLNIDDINGNIVIIDRNKTRIRREKV